MSLIQLNGEAAAALVILPVLIFFVVSRGWPFFNLKQDLPAAIYARLECAGWGVSALFSLVFVAVMYGVATRLHG